MENLIGIAIESLVAVLLAATIVYCAVLDRRLRRLRGDETMMRQTIGELVGATHAAERSIVALRATVGACEETLAERLGKAQGLSQDMARQLAAGEEVIERITKIAKAAREHASRVASREQIDQLGAEREAARLEARRRAEEEARVAAARREAAERERAAPPVLSASAATAAAAELFASRVRALSLGDAA
ncbi:DUF6682 family protein [Hansschlegelia beijingensis]|uniref:DUF6468 domain-containing protein n=1 Tax=Hansschlegelia beijingensis TaxID=1133344 RepID=A0A7W6D0C5_9HYPH|nr:DUF6682 family protein [Hansschlegelia beijingensis]MBB3973539.1 hypothetical protein [Hansschlegelia beijingensis]